MKNKAKKILKKINNFIINNKTIIFNSILLFLVFFLISYFIPLTGDDWTNANFNTNNIFNIINIAWDKYFLHEGRLASRVFVIFFTNTKWLWNIVNAAMISGIYFFSMKIIKPKNVKLASVIFILAMLLLENTMFTQSYLWVTGNCTYVLPMFLCILYLVLVDKVWDENWQSKKIYYIIMIILNVFIPTMVEHISVSLVVINLLLSLIYYLKNKKINKLLLTNLIISIVGFLIIYLSPGAQLRASEYEFSNYSLFKKIIVNIPNFINYTFIKNTFLIILIIILINVFIFYKHKINFKRICASILINIIPIITIISNVLYLIAEKSSKARFILGYIDFSVDSTNIFIILYWIFIALLLLFINYKNFKETKDFKALFFYIIGMIANCSMLLSPIWGGRTSLFTVIMLYINFIILLESKVEWKLKTLTKLLYTFLILYCFILLILYNSVYRQSINREKAIKEQLEKDYNTIVIERFPDQILWNSNAYNTFHEGSFKKYYGIPEDKKIERVKIGYKYFLLYEVKKDESNN